MSTMLDLLPIINNNGLAFVILAMILFASLHRRELTSLQNRLFIVLISLNMLLAILDTLGWFFNGKEGTTNFWLNNVSNSFLYAAAPLPAAIWLLYVHCQTESKALRFRTLKLLILPLLAVNLVISLLSLRYNLYFFVNDANLYQRGTAFIVHLFINYIHILAAWALAIYSRKSIDRRQLWAIVFYPLPIIIGSIIQAIWFGLALNWITMAIAILLIFIHLENRSLKTDHLTGIYNRRHIEQVIFSRIRRAASDQSFSLILADLDNFKRINDQYGHKTGDDALIRTASLLRGCLRQQDQVARVGGDEFYIVLDLADKTALDMVTERIERSLADFNRTSPFKWNLTLSMGAAIYDPDSNLTAEEFLSYVDQLMYKEKARHQEKASRSVS